jgi:uncharacterized membrane protein YhaH (DUF805 family)
MSALNPLIMIGVFTSTALTDAVYVLFNAAVSQRRRIRAATWSSIWYLLSAFAVISYTHNAMYVLFAASGSWVGAFCAMSWLGRDDRAASAAGVESAISKPRAPR